MEVWAGIVGVLVGGLLMLVGNYFTNKSADGRLRIQLNHEAQQAQDAQVLAVQLESIDQLQAFISTTTGAMPDLVRAPERSGPEKAAAHKSMMTGLQRARVLTIALGDKDASAMVRNVTEALKSIEEAEDVEATMNGASDLTIALASLERCCTELKIKAIRMKQSVR